VDVACHIDGYIVDPGLVAQDKGFERGGIALNRPAYVIDIFVMFLGFFTKRIIHLRLRLIDFLISL
jgi:hypothetical protein